MTAKFFAILTNQGAARLANAAALGIKLNLSELAVGDGGGVLPMPDAAQTALLGEQRRAPLNMLSVDPTNTSQIIAEQIIPENEGGFWIREIGLYDDDGVLIAVANCPETYKPKLQEGSGRTQTIRMVLIVSSTEAVTLKIDPAVVLATRQYVDDKVIEVKTYADNLMNEHIKAAHPHKQYPLIANALKEIADAGLVSEVLENLQLKEAAKREVGTGANQIPDMNAFPYGSQWFQLPSGHIVQMFQMTVNGADVGGTSGNYPIVFPSAILAATAIWSDGTTSPAPTYKMMGTDRAKVTLKVSLNAGSFGTMIMAVGR
ncbi:MAG TPA: phage tail protein [Buttiauxella sp.]|jgi:phage-related tail fiber protein